MSDSTQSFEQQPPVLDETLAEDLPRPPRQFIAYGHLFGVWTDAEWNRDVPPAIRSRMHGHLASPSGVFTVRQLADQAEEDRLHAEMVAQRMAPAGPDDDQDDEALEDDAPASSPPIAAGYPASRRVVAWRDRGPQPLLRASLTLTAPWDTGWGEPSPTTLEIIVLAESAHEDDVTARVADLPELNEGGWRGLSANGLDIHFRTIG
jgi:hypothetical protein